MLLKHIVLLEMVKKIEKMLSSKTYLDDILQEVSNYKDFAYSFVKERLVYEKLLTVTISTYLNVLKTLIKIIIIKNLLII